MMLFDANDKIQMIGADERGLSAGQVGRVIARRQTDGDIEPQYLCKFERKAGPVSVSQSQINGVQNV